MRFNTKEIKVYDFAGIFDGFCVEAHEVKDTTELYLYHNNYGIKSLMFGVLTNSIKSEWELRDLIASNIENHIDIYQDVYMD